MDWRKQMFDFALSNQIHSLMSTPDDGIRFTHKPDAGWFHERASGEIKVYHGKPQARKDNTIRYHHSYPEQRVINRFPWR